MRTALAVLCIILVGTNAFAEISPLSAPYLYRPNDAQGTAMGLTGVAYHEGLFSIYSNPAALAFVGKKGFGFCHVPTAAKVGDNYAFNQENMVLAWPLPKGVVLGLSYFYYNFGKNQVEYMYDGEDYLEKELHFYLNHQQLTGAKLIQWPGSSLSFGFSMKNVHVNFVEKESTVLFSVGSRFKKLFDNERALSLGVSVGDLGQGLRFSSATNERERHVQLLRAGVAFETGEFAGSGIGLLATAEYQRNLNKTERPLWSYYQVEYNKWHHLGLGLEAQFLRHLFVRGGYTVDLGEKTERYRNQGVTYGLGFSAPSSLHIIVPFRLSVSYGKGLSFPGDSFIPSNYHLVSFDLDFM